MVTFLFWLSLFLLLWTYFGYFALLWVLSKFPKREYEDDNEMPEVTLIITAYNEEARIKEKLENTLALSYPRGKMEIIVVSDGSTDRTEEIVRNFHKQGIQLLAIPERHGKHYGQHRGFELAKNDILIFTDATTFLPCDAAEKIVRNFADSRVGAVSSMDKIKSTGSNSSGEGAYVRYEMRLRYLESRVCSLVGVSGCFFAVRKHICEGWVDEMSSDFFIPILAYMKGQRTVLESEAIGYYDVLSDPKSEFIRKVRTVLHGFEVFFKFKNILNPFKYGFYSFQLLNHKLSRWLVPLYLILILWTNFLLVDYGNVYLGMFVLQSIFYMLALAAWFINRLKNVFIFKYPFFFVMVNYSILMAWHNYLTGKKIIQWEPTKR